MILNYKVIEIKQRTAETGYMTAAQLEREINSWARFGWALDRMTSGETQGFLHGKEVFLLIFKKQIEVPDGLYLMIDDQQIGPVDEEGVRHLKGQQSVNLQTLACTKDLNEWKPLAEVSPDLAEMMANF